MYVCLQSQLQKKSNFVSKLTIRYMRKKILNYFHIHLVLRNRFASKGSTIEVMDWFREKNIYQKKMLRYTPSQNVWSRSKSVVMFGLIKILNPFLLTSKLWLVFMGMNKKKKIKMPDSKKTHFPKSPILNIFFQKFHGLVLGLLELIDAKGIGVARPIWSWGSPT